MDKFLIKFAKKMQAFAISPIDGRYRNKVEKLAQYFSEFALTKYRLFVEIKYFIGLQKVLSSIIPLNEEQSQSILNVFVHFHEKDFERIKELEHLTNHDVKAVELFLREKFEELGLSACKEWIHFGLTSQDINNTAFPMMIRDAFQQVILPEMKTLLHQMENLAIAWLKTPMMSRTHGQPASPTTMGKEWMVYVERLKTILQQLEKFAFEAKFGGAVGNFNAHYAAFPNIKWTTWADEFVKKEFNLIRQQWTTQIEHYDTLGLFFKILSLWNTVLIDFSRDIWLYIMLDYFRLKQKENEVGSSTMPHKVNPIDFENAEGNLGLANALFHHLADKLPISRLQRDLSDSTVLRNVGVPFAHSLIALKSLQKGIDHLALHEEQLIKDLNEHWEVVTEAIQTILRRHAFPNAYDLLKQMSRGQHRLTKDQLHAWIDRLDIDTSIKEELKKITPMNYLGFLTKYKPDEPY